MTLAEFALANPVAAVAMVVVVACAVVGLVDRLTEPRRLIARAEADRERAALLREQREASRLPKRPTTPPPPPPAPKRLRDVP